MEQKVEKQASLESVPVKRLKRELKYQGTILKMYEDTVEVNGHQAKWDFIHHDGAAAVLPVTEDGKILMVRQYRNALDRYTLEIPAGKLDSLDEAKIDCAYRELEEETGYRCDHLEYLMSVNTVDDLYGIYWSVNTTIAFCDEALDIFLARDLKKTHQHLDPDEEIEVEAWELSDLLKRIYAGELTDGKTVSAILAYACKAGQK